MEFSHIDDASLAPLVAVLHSLHCFSHIIVATMQSDNAILVYYTRNWRSRALNE